MIKGNPSPANDSLMLKLRDGKLVGVYTTWDLIFTVPNEMNTKVYPVKWASEIRDLGRLPCKADVKHPTKHNHCETPELKPDEETQEVCLTTFVPPYIAK